jgi:excisionase family DNA binding protein
MPNAPGTMRSVSNHAEAPSAGPLLLRIREVATLLAVSERQVWVLIRAGQLDAIHPRGMRAVLVARADVEALVGAWRAERATE